MRILYHHRVVSRDGQAVHIEALVEALRQAGAEVEVAGPPLAEEEGRPSAAGVLRRRLPKALVELAELAWGLWSAVRLVRRARRLRPDVIYERYGLHLLGGAIAARLLGLPLLVEVNAPLAEERARHGGLALEGLARRTEAWIWRAADHVFVVSGPLVRAAAQAGVPVEWITLTPNGVDPRAFADLPTPAEAKATLGLSGRTVLGFTGFVRPWHGLDRVVELLAELPRSDVVLVVAGDGPARPQLEERARALGVAERVRWLGVVERVRLPRILPAFDVALQPAVVPWASPLKIFEYMAAGCCILAVDSPNIREILEDGRTALLAPPEAFGAALVRLLRDAELRRRLGEAARRAVFERGFTWPANARRVLEVAQRFAARRAPRRAPHPAG
ncbi:Alpha-D-kanosaminyltransferase [bacterium HR39]|nr:Alpha-D-kanosaminyltransferase [bacterium HR39]